MICLKLSVEWLKDYVDIDDDIQKLSDDLTMSGSEVEEIQKPFEKIKGVISAKVINVMAHPNADNLNICKLSDGTKTYTVVTSDKSVKVDDFVAFGPADKASDVDGKIVRSVDMRGIKTDGMLFSLEELGLESHSNHVFRFEKPVEVGAEIVKIFDLDQIAFEIEITPNRPDCLSHIGLAREVATVNRKTLKIPKVKVDIPQGNVLISTESSECLRYFAIKIDGITVKDSPLWLKKRLATVGMRSINNIADITNYIMMETGHPIHAFDFDKIPSHKIVVKNAKGGEKFTALNSKTYTLDGGEILITDGEQILALAGVIGGKDSGITKSTKSILIEVATFDPVRTRKTSKGLNLSTDASYRFERGVDPNDTIYVAKRIVEMTLSLAGGRVTGSSDIYPKVVEPVTVKLSNKKLSSYMSFTPDPQEVSYIFNALEMKVSKDQNGWTVEVPTFRQDVSQDVDLIEEFARIHGFSNVQSVMSMPFIRGDKNEWWDFKNKMRFLLTSLGYFENVNYAFSDPKAKKLFGNTFNESPKLLNPVSPEMSIMRPSLLLNLIDALAYNVKHQENDVKFFEIGKIFEEEQESEKIAFVSTGKIEPLDYTDKRMESLINLKGDLETIANYFHIDLDFTNEESEGFVSGQCGKIVLNGTTIGLIGRLSEDVTSFFDLDLPIYACEFDLKKIFKAIQTFEYRTSSQYPVSFKDLSMFVQKGKIHASEIIKVAKISSEYVKDVRVIDLYTGKGVPAGSYSITIRITYSSMDRTLLDEEIDGAFSKLMEVIESMGITLRKVR